MNGAINLLGKHLHYCALSTEQAAIRQIVSKFVLHQQSSTNRIYTQIAKRKTRSTFKIKLDHFFSWAQLLSYGPKARFAIRVVIPFLAFQFRSIKIQIEIKSGRKKIDGPYQKVHRQ